MKIDREFDPAIEAAVDSYVAQNNLVRQNKDIGMDQGDAVVSDSVQSILLPMIQAMVDPDDIRSDLALAAFDDIPLLKRIELLIEFAAGHHTADTHWPLPELVFNELSLADNFDGLDMDAISSAIIETYTNRLTPKQRNHMREYSFCIGFEVLERCVQDWQIRVLEHTAGQNECADASLGQEISQWFGAAPLPDFSLALDFRQISGNDKGDWQSNTVVDPTGACFLDAKPRPIIVLFARRLRQYAQEAGIPNRLRDFCMIALVHELAHLAHLGVKDLDGIANPRISQSWIEAVANYITGQWAQRNRMEPVFDKFMKSQTGNEAYSSLKTCSIEIFRVYLWFLRRGGALEKNCDFQDWFCALHPKLPPLPRPT